MSGRWNQRHELLEGEQTLGVLTVERNRSGMVIQGEYQPEAGELYYFRRDPGLLRSQFSMWTDGREWLGSSLRWSFMGRAVHLSTGTKPYRLLPLPGFRRGWGLYAPKTGETAQIRVGMVGRAAELDVYRRIDISLLLFAYFLGSQIYGESLLPGPSPEKAVQG
ncbi:MAG: hypothetical protein AAF682_05275 [Planctomycetota bacterium]